jgi:hypothetical protein
MKIPIIKKTVENFSLEDLKKAEEQLLNEEIPAIDIEGVDEGEQLTHCMAAIWIKEEIEKNGISQQQATRNYIDRVRKSIT